MKPDERAIYEQYRRCSTEVIRRDLSIAEHMIHLASLPGVMQDAWLAQTMRNVGLDSIEVQWPDGSTTMEQVDSLPRMPEGRDAGDVASEATAMARALRRVLAERDN